jgi:hypothetical protein
MLTRRPTLTPCVLMKYQGRIGQSASYDVVRNAPRFNGMNASNNRLKEKYLIGR